MLSKCEGYPSRAVMAQYNISMTDTWCNCSPTSAFEHHLIYNSAVPDSAPLFAFETVVGMVSNETWVVPCLLQQNMGAGRTVKDQRDHVSRMGFLIRLKSKKVEIGQEKTL